MEKIVKISLIDRLDRKHEFEVHNGQPMQQFLIGKYIPSGSILLKVNGSIRDDQTYQISDKDEIELKMVRAYQLPEYCKMLEIWDENKNPPPNDSIYTNKILWFNESGICEMKNASISKENFSSWLERRFIDSLKFIKKLTQNDRICLPLSGGRDSLALLYLLERTKKELPDFSIVGVTVAPTVASIGDLDIAKNAIKALGIKDYHILDSEYVKTTIKFKNEFSTVMTNALSNQGRGITISLWHGIMKACIERFCRDNDLTKIAYGYQHEDLMASLLRSNLLGVSFGESMIQKSFGRFELIFPLWAITKKELTIYLNLIAPNQQSNQSNPTQYDRGDHNRDIHYFLADLLSTVYPGIGFSLFEAYEQFNHEYNVKIKDFCVCKNCLASFPEETQSDSDQILCSTCEYFKKCGEIS